MVKKVFIDTNVWLRFILKDQEDQFKWTKELIEKIETGKFKPYTSAIVLLEINYVLLKIYKISFKMVKKIINGIVLTRNLAIIDKTNWQKAWQWRQKYKVKLADCLIVSSLVSGCQLITWDKEFKKFTSLSVKTPEQIIKNKN